MNNTNRAAQAILIGIVGAGSASAQDSIEIEPKHIAEFIIDGRATQMEIAPDGSGTPIVNAEVATDLGFEGSMVGGIRMVGPTKVTAESNMARIDFGDGDLKKRRVFWFSQPWTDIAEGRTGPHILPASIITYRLAPTVAGEKIISFPMKSGQRTGLYTEAIVQDEEVRAYFTFDRAETMVTAATGALLAQDYEGEMVGEARIIPIELTIDRPVRSMEFQTKPMIGGLLLRNIVVRTQDTGSTDGIPDETDDPNEIVVTAESKNKPTYRIYIGTESLAGCSTLTFDKEQDQIRLSCML